jgi:peptide deformylase
MPVLKIYAYPESILRQKAEPIKDIDEPLQKLIDDMYETMHYASGVGLAATQIGEKNAVFVVDVPLENTKNRSYAIINPSIVETEGESSIEEGCLSLPGFRLDVQRYARIVVKGYDRYGKDLVVEADGLLAIAIQHELDHLNGITLIDHASLIKRTSYIKSLKKEKQDT